MKSGFYWLFLGAAIVCGGCGGGGASLSGPDSNTQKGLGTLVVRVLNADDSSVADGAAIVALERAVKFVRDGKTTFYNLQPGRYFVQTRSQSIGLPGDGRNVEIKADKTLTIALKLAPVIAGN